jgi:hypothetical protein
MSVKKQTFSSVSYSMSVICPVGLIWLSVRVSSVKNLRTTFSTEQSAAGIFRFPEWFYVVVLNFQIELWCRYFGYFGLGNFFGYFFQNLGKFFSNLLVTLLESHKDIVKLNYKLIRALLHNLLACY